ncbi:MAG: hypothetical protein K6L81_01940 [Agarilytica sp.]
MPLLSEYKQHAASVTHAVYKVPASYTSADGRIQNMRIPVRKLSTPEFLEEGRGPGFDSGMSALQTYLRIDEKDIAVVNRGDSFKIEETVYVVDLLETKRQGFHYARAIER